YIRSPPTWDAALQTCRRMGGTLAQVRVPVTDSQRVRVNSQDERRASAINQALL
ncbi:hypothetical protein AAVH_37498, partial [Aphelenchoides avenae]